MRDSSEDLSSTFVPAIALAFSFARIPFQIATFAQDTRSAIAGTQAFHQGEALAARDLHASMQSGHREPGFAANNPPPWESVRECASDLRMRIAREIMKVHNVQRLPSLYDAVSFKTADSGASGAASLSSLLDKVLIDHSSAVPSRQDLVAQQQKRKAAAAKAIQTQLQPLAATHTRGEKSASAVTDKVVSADAGMHVRRRVGHLPRMSERAEDTQLEWDDGDASIHEYDGVSIKSRTRSRQGDLSWIALSRVAGQLPALLSYVLYEQAWTSFALKSDRELVVSKQLKCNNFIAIFCSSSPPSAPLIPSVPHHRSLQRSHKNGCKSPHHPRSLPSSPAHLTPRPQGIIMRRWSQPSLKAAEGQLEAAASAAGDVLHPHVFQCFPNVVVVVACSHTSLNRSAREAALTSVLHAQAMLHRRHACVQCVIDTQPVVCDDVLPQCVSFFDFPPKFIIPQHSKVLLITSCDDASFTLRPPRSLPLSCIMCVNTILETTPDLKLCKNNIKCAITTAYDQPSTLSDLLVLKASQAENCTRADKWREDALDAAYTLAFLAFCCKVMSQPSMRSCLSNLFWSAYDS